MGTFRKFLPSKDEKISMVWDGAGKKNTTASPFVFLQLMFVFPSAFSSSPLPCQEEAKRTKQEPLENKHESKKKSKFRMKSQI